LANVSDEGRWMVEREREREKDVIHRINMDVTAGEKETYGTLRILYTVSHC
jgi:hypothetical protein